MNLEHDLKMLHHLYLYPCYHVTVDASYYSAWPENNFYLFFL